MFNNQNLGLHLSKPQHPDIDLRLIESVRAVQEISEHNLVPPQLLPSKDANNAPPISNLAHNLDRQPHAPSPLANPSSGIRLPSEQPLRPRAAKMAKIPPRAANRRRQDARAPARRHDSPVAQAPRSENELHNTVRREPRQLRTARKKTLGERQAQVGHRMRHVRVHLGGGRVGVGVAEGGGGRPRRSDIRDIPELGGGGLEHLGRLDDLFVDISGERRAALFQEGAAEDDERAAEDHIHNLDLEAAAGFGLGDAEGAAPDEGGGGHRLAAAREAAGDGQARCGEGQVLAVVGGGDEFLAGGGGASEGDAAHGGG